MIKFRNVKLVLCSLIFVLGISNVNAQAPNKWKLTNEQRQQLYKENKEVAKYYDAATYTGTQKVEIMYRLLKPENYDSTKKYPIVVSLHGAGFRGNDNYKSLSLSICKVLLSTENRTKYPCFVFVPQCPSNYDWGCTPSQKDRERELTRVKQYPPSVDTSVIEIIRLLEKKYSIDTTRRYVVGASMGAYGAWHILITRPIFFSAAVPISGGADPNCANKLLNIPIWAFHGAADSTVPVEYTREIIGSIKKHGGNPIYTETPEAGHGHFYELAVITETPNLLEWLFSKSTKYEIK